MSLPCPRHPIALGPVALPDASYPSRARNSALNHVLADGFPYSKRLNGHTSCVNALVFSHGNGRWLASAGDDLTVLLWDVHHSDIVAPSFTFTGPRANVFALAFSATDHYLYSGDTNNKIYQYDLSYLSSAGPQQPSTASAVFQQHDDSIRAISCHPEQEHIFLSASEDGRIILHDVREPAGPHARAQNVLQHDAEFTSVQHHPSLAHIFATSDARGDVCLRDARMAFGPRMQRSKQGVVQTYVTTLSKQSVGHLCKPEVSSIVFDYTGTRLAATMLFYDPVIYAVNDPFPLAVCTGDTRPHGEPVPAGERTYCNTCTIKHGSFGGPALGDACYYSAGSDDFCAYVWKVPDIPVLVDARVELDAEDWNAGYSSLVTFATGRLEPHVLPTELATPFCRLAGHQSIVNTTLLHPSLLYLATAGIERVVLLHSPSAHPPSTGTSAGASAGASAGTSTSTSTGTSTGLARTAGAVRALPAGDLNHERLFRQAAGLGPALDEPDDDSGAIALFDEIIRQEGESDVFVQRHWSPERDDITAEEPDIG